jgi:serine/threonine protein phosphatase PrpC
MGEELDKPILEKNPIDGKTSIFKYGMNQIQGWKKSMEVYNIKQLDVGQRNNINIFGIFDGHSGKEIAQFLSNHFISELIENNNFINGNYSQALIDTFKNLDISLRTKEVNKQLIIYSNQNNFIPKEKIDNLYRSIDIKNTLDSNDIDALNIFMDIIDPNNLEGVFISDYVGSSGIIVLISEKITYVANAGNSHCIAINKNLSIINDKNIIEQSMFNNNEKKRIKIAKGLKYGKEKINEYENEEYLYTRGFGNFQYKSNNLLNLESQEITSEPEIFEISNEDIKLLIICNSGFFESYRIINNNNSNINNKNIEKNIAEYFIEKLNNKEKIISDSINEYFMDYIFNGKKKNQIINDSNLSCIIIEFIDK